MPSRRSLKIVTHQIKNLRRLVAISRRRFETGPLGLRPAGPATRVGRSRGRKPRRRPAPPRSGDAEAVARPAGGEPARERAGGERTGTAKRGTRMLARGVSLFAIGQGEPSRSDGGAIRSGGGAAALSWAYFLT